MDFENIEQLLKKYEQGVCTKQELQMIYDWYENLNYNQEDAIFKDENHRDLLKKSIKDKIRKQISFPNTYKTSIPIFRISFQRKIWTSIAAMFLVAVGIGGMVYLQNNRTQQIKYTLIKTGPGKIKQLLLADGTTVYLNSKSTLKFPESFDQKTREVYLDGEAYFEVFKNPDKPFIIHSNKLQTQVLGTHFNVKAYHEDAINEITVLEGKVSVKDDHSKVILISNQKVAYDTNSHFLSQSIVANPNDYKAWTERKLIFNGLRLDEIALILSRRYNKIIRIENNNLAKCQITTHFEEVPLDKILTILCAYTGAHYRKVGNEILLQGNGCN